MTDYMLNKTTITVPNKLRNKLWTYKKRTDSLASVIDRILKFYEENSIIEMEDDESVKE